MVLGIVASIATIVAFATGATAVNRMIPKQPEIVELPTLQGEHPGLDDESVAIHEPNDDDGAPNEAVKPGQASTSAGAWPEDDVDDLKPSKRVGETSSGAKAWSKKEVDDAEHDDSDRFNKETDEWKASTSKKM